MVYPDWYLTVDNGPGMKAPLLCAVQFLTRLPIDSVDDYSPSTLGHSVLYYPLVGLLIGVVLSLLHWFMGGMDSSLQAAVLLVVWVLISGALHIDGLADLVDAWVGAHGDRDRMMDIMKDATSGPMAVTAVVLLLLVKFAALSVVLEQELMFALLLVPLIGRAGLLAALRLLPYVRPEGLGSVLVEHLPKRKALRVLWACALLPVLLMGWQGVAIVVVVAVSFFAIGGALKRRLGGITGDCAGAICELLEAVALVALVALH